MRCLSFTQISAYFLPLCLFLGCSTPESQQRLDTTLCWLRPSCLPQDQDRHSPLTTPSNQKPPPSPSASKEAEPTRTSTQPPSDSVSDQMGKGPTCQTTAQTRVKASQTSITVRYMEPTTNSQGQALLNLTKTTLYYDLGKGWTKIADIPATNPRGGGTIQKTISLKTSRKDSMDLKICVTATNINGLEG